MPRQPALAVVDGDMEVGEREVTLDELLEEISLDETDGDEEDLAGVAPTSADDTEAVPERLRLGHFGAFTLTPRQQVKGISRFGRFEVKCPFHRKSRVTV